MAETARKPRKATAKAPAQVVEEATFKEDLPHIACACGEKFQVLNQAKDDWNRETTEAEFEHHLPNCPGAPPEPEE